MPADQNNQSPPPDGMEWERTTPPESQLSHLPRELIHLIASNLDVADLNCFARSSTYLNDLLSPSLYRIGATYIRNDTDATALIWAVRNGLNVAVERLLLNGADPYILTPRRSNNGSSTAFHAAVRRRNTEALSLLLQVGPCPSTIDTSGKTPLQIACFPGGLGMVRMILAAAPENWVDYNRDWYYSMSIAVTKNCEDIARCLLEAGRRTNPTPARALKPELIIHATRKGHLGMVQLLAEFGWNDWGLVSHETKFITPLHLAAKKGHADLAELLISYGADVNAGDSEGLTPLWEAVVRARSATVDVLLKAGADANAIFPDGNKGSRTLLHISAINGVVAIAHLLLSAGARVNDVTRYKCSALNYAAVRGHLSVVELLLDWGCDMNAIKDYGYTPLAQAVAGGHDRIVALLLSRGAHVDAKEDALNPLTAAAIHKRVSLIQPLVNAGFMVNPGPSFKQEKPPVFHTTDLAVIKEFIRCGANVRILMEDGSSILHHVAKKADPETIQFLIDQGADINAFGPNKETALHVAVANEDRMLFKRCKVLVLAGIDLDARNADGETAIHYAIRHDRWALEDLLDAGADANVPDLNGTTPLLFAASIEERCYMIEWLVKAGADVTAEDKSGQTALHYFAVYRIEEAFEMLLLRHEAVGHNYMKPDAEGLTVADKAVKSLYLPILTLLYNRKINGMDVLDAEQRVLVEDLLQKQTDK
ncbi:uncharacterized protein DSM5745_04472 [Aspergillus mulundensis]|uniref:Uncharacterized protein n=1 Tax=Aspergillus mulundensis TaxID=1810919 RepID=A0A3D8SCS9_9EURO|nr:hypothetical protein DSM5745_04472 [Aspergillus mulundensis]RDW84146.1 hypothetical protein DSM5745_04472 [Aspergillus mulundensis]